MLFWAILACSVVPSAASNAFANGQIYMPIFLGIATIANGFMLVWAWQAWKRGSLSEAVGLSTLMLADLIWCLPCFIQCVGTAAQGSFWGGDVGCDVMGFYSAFATYSSQMATLLMAFLTYHFVFFSVLPKWTTVVLTGVGIFGSSCILALLPLIGIGSFVPYEGFCYVDYRNPVHCAVWLFIMLPCICGVFYCYLQIFRHSTQPQAIRRGLLGLWFVFFCGWILGIPLIIIGMSGGKYPKGLNLVSAILGHFQNLVNPILYGVLWYKWFVEGPQRLNISEDSA